MRWLMGWAMIVLPLSNVWAVGDPIAGRVKAKACVQCHGERGEGIGSMPKLEGYSRQQIVQQLLDYKHGRRQHVMMNTIASKLSERDIADIAAFFASMH